ncbi:MAG: cation:dicarboxylase symporter family transporter [Solirubrobacterales bacterium]|nr:cation:dicarboxylase symporter family transporter [Solirubrobacterales bacterium]
MSTSTRGDGEAGAAEPRTAADERGGVTRQLWFWVLIAIALGILFGFVAPDTATKAKWLADAFIQLIKTITGPVIFVTVIIGIASLGDMAKAGGLAARALGYFLTATIVALTLGLLAANLVKPGAGLDATASEDGKAAAEESIKEAGGGEGLVPFITDNLLPDSLAGPFVENEILRVLVLAILTAAAISALPQVKRERVVGGFQTASQILFRIITLIMWLAPLAAFGGMAYTVSEFGGQSLGNLAKLLITFWATCAIFVFLILGLVARLSGFNIFRFIRMLKDELLIIVGTSSSETVLPRLLRKLEAAGASRQVVGVVIPTGYSFNLDGTCIYLTLGALFILQAAGQDMAIGEQIALAGLMVLTSKGAAGITGAGLVTLTASLQAFGGEFFSAEAIAVGIALVVGIDRIMSEGRALTNCIGNGVATMVVAKWQGERDDERFQAALRDPREVERITNLGLDGPDAVEREAERHGASRPSGSRVAVPAG